jgi:hypothetical protein
MTTPTTSKVTTSTSKCDFCNRISVLQSIDDVEVKGVSAVA